MYVIPKARICIHVYYSRARARAMTRAMTRTRDMI